MRRLADADRIRRFMRALAREAGEDTRVYFTGGATAVLLGWRPTTIDVDIKIVPEHDRILRAIPDLKEALQINVEFASPLDFIPVAPDWAARSVLVDTEGIVSFYHFDLYAQALSKIERGHAQDIADVRELVRSGLVDPERAVAYFESIEADLYRYPAIDPASFRRSVVEYLRPA